MIPVENRLDVTAAAVNKASSAPQTRRNSVDIQQKELAKGRKTSDRTVSKNLNKRSRYLENPRAISLPNCSSAVKSLSTTTTPRHHSASDSEALTREFFREWTMVSSQSEESLTSYDINDTYSCSRNTPEKCMNVVTSCGEISRLAPGAPSSPCSVPSSCTNFVRSSSPSFVPNSRSWPAGGWPASGLGNEATTSSRPFSPISTSSPSPCHALHISSPMTVPRSRKVSLCYVQRASNLSHHPRHSPSPVRKPSLGLHVPCSFPQSPLARASSSSMLTDYGSQILVDRVRSPSIDSSGSSGCASPPSFFRVVVLGAPGVGKSALVSEMAGDSHCDMLNDDTPNDGEHVLVNVHLDDQESTVELIDCPVDSNMDSVRPDAFLVVYSVSDRKSYLTAAEVTRYLRCDLGTDRTVFLVANKTDLRRQQRVSTKEGEQLACKYDFRFLETSAVLRMNVDTLLVRVLENIRGQLSPPGDLTPSEDAPCRRHSSSPSRAFRFLSKLVRPSRGKRSAINSDDLCVKR